MEHVIVSMEKEVAVVRLFRGKVNALNLEVVTELADAFASIEQDPAARAVVLTGTGSFFSFGFDIPHFLGCSRGDFSRYLTAFTDLYTAIFGFPKPVVAALNGHTVAGGCMLALACDRRIMVGGKSKISLNEIGFGSSVFAGSVEMLRFCVGGPNAQKVLYSGAMFTARQAEAMGLVDRVCPNETLAADALAMAEALGAKAQPAFAEIKALLRGPVVDQMRAGEASSIRTFVNIWYSPETWEQIKQIQIRE